MNGICDWPGCDETDTINYSVDPKRRRELCVRHLEAFIALKGRAGIEKAFRKIDKHRKEAETDLDYPADEACPPQCGSLES